MRRLLFVSALVLGALPTVALGANGGAAKTFSITGVVRSATTTSLTVHGAFDATCRLTPYSPSTGTLGVGDRVRIVCRRGVLAKILRLGPSVNADAGARPTSSTTTPLTTATATAGGTGSITALSSTSITVTGDRSITCAITASVAGLSDVHVGDVVRIGCVNGGLYYIVAAAPPATTTATTPTTTSATAPTGSPNTYGFGTISGLTATTITVTGDNTLSCELTSTSPPVGNYHVGDPVKIACQNNLLVGIVPNTNTAPAPSTSSATQNASSGRGTITALSSTSITVTGDQTLTCAIGSSSPAPSAYGITVGAHVAIGCQNGVLSHLSSIA